jgi:hypothetical protein
MLQACTSLSQRLRVQGSGFRVQGSGFRVPGSGCRVQGSGLRVQGSGFRGQGSGVRVRLSRRRRLPHSCPCLPPQSAALPSRIGRIGGAPRAPPACAVLPLFVREMLIELMTSDRNIEASREHRPCTSGVISRNVLVHYSTTPVRTGAGFKRLFSNKNTIWLASARSRARVRGR